MDINRLVCKLSCCGSLFKRISSFVYISLSILWVSKQIRRRGGRWSKKHPHWDIIYGWPLIVWKCLIFFPTAKYFSLKKPFKILTWKARQTVQMCWKVDWELSHYSNGLMKGKLDRPSWSHLSQASVLLLSKKSAVM